MIVKLPNLPIASGTRVLLRASINVPVDNLRVLDTFRLEKILPTLSYLKKREAVTIILGHVGREASSVRPIFRELAKRMSLAYIPEVIGEEVTAVIKNARPGDTILLENVRKQKGEESNDQEFAQALAKLAEVYVNDAFPASHREHASIVGVPKFIHAKGMGLQFEKELQALSDARAPQAPALCILGGAKFETKEPLIEALLAKYDTVFIGGALANDFLKGRGYEVGTSKISSHNVPRRLLSNERIMLPVDVTVDSDFGVRICSPEEVREHERIVDIGPDTLEKLSALLPQCKAVLWNGPLGIYEEKYIEPSLSLARAIGESAAFSVVGGGDTVAALRESSLSEHFSFVSTAGGAMLEFLLKGTLPGVDALKSEQ